MIYQIDIERTLQECADINRWLWECMVEDGITVPTSTTRATLGFWFNTPNLRVAKKLVKQLEKIAVRADVPDPKHNHGVLGLTPYELFRTPSQIDDWLRQLLTIGYPFGCEFDEWIDYDIEGFDWFGAAAAQIVSEMRQESCERNEALGVCEHTRS